MSVISTEEARILVQEKLDRKIPISRAEARALRRWGEANPEVVKAALDREHEHHAEIIRYSVLTEHFTSVHPVQPDGSPQPEWTDPEPLVKDAEEEADPKAPAPAITNKLGQPIGKAEAERRMEKIRADMDGPYWNTAHPLHRATKEEMLMLTAVATGDASIMQGVRPWEERRAEEIRADPSGAYWNAQHPEHGAMVADVAALDAQAAAAAQPTKEGAE